jgi:hypothetical protein
MSKPTLHAIVLGLVVGLVLGIGGVPAWTLQWFLAIAINSVAVVFSVVKVNSMLEERKK